MKYMVIIVPNVQQEPERKQKSGWKDRNELIEGYRLYWNSSIGVRSKPFLNLKALDKFRIKINSLGLAKKEGEDFLVTRCMMAKEDLKEGEILEPPVMAFRPKENEGKSPSENEI